MLPPTHLAGGYLIGKLTQKQANIFPYWTATVSFFAVIPDIDLLWLWETHRFSALHFPSFWIAIFVVLRIISTFTKKRWIGTFGLALLLGSLSHIILDSLGIFEGIYWLYPLNSVKYSILPITTALPNHNIFALIAAYFSHPVILLESALWIVAAGVAAGYELRSGTAHSFYRYLTMLGKKA